MNNMHILFTYGNPVRGRKGILQTNTPPGKVWHHINFSEQIKFVERKEWYSHQKLFLKDLKPL